MDDIECGSFFDTIDDLLDVPTEDITGNGSPVAGGKGCSAFPSLWFDNPSEGLLGCDSVFSGNNSASDLSAELSVPSEDIAQLEWLSHFVEESFSCESSVTRLEKQAPTTITPKDDSSTQNSSSFRTSSPISVLESSNSCSMAGKTLPRGRALDTDVLACAKPGRARSKRGRPASFKPRPAFHLLSPAFSTGESLEDESLPQKKHQKPGDHEKKKRKIKLSVLGPHSPAETDANTTAAQGVRKCLHCEITKTPQWRGGPMGPKTLCNACGVRYKSGRLFPEYRPAASPTFVPSIHSNSHKKVLEMRTKTGEVFTPLLDNAMMPAATMSPVTATAATATSAAGSQSEVGSNSNVEADWM